MRAALYARVSDEEQVEGYSLDAQARAFQQFCEQKGWHVYRAYVEEGRSARTEDLRKRPLFQEVIRDALAHKYDVLVVHKLDRFARNARITLEYLEKLEKAGIAFVSLSEQMDFSTPIGRVMLANLAAFGQYYSDNLATEVSKGLKERAEQGLWNGPLAFGYRKADDGSPVVVEEEARAIVKVFEMYASGRYTHRQLAAWLNTTGVSPRVRLRDTSNANPLWSADAIRYMLRNAFYLGYVKYKGKLLAGKHKPILTKELFDKVRQVTKEHRTAPSTFTPHHRTYLLSGLVRCVHCGTKLSAHHISGHVYYQEASVRRGIPCPIRSKRSTYIRGDHIEAQVSDIMSSLRLPDSWRDMVLDMLNSREEMDTIAKERARLEEKTRRIKRQYRDVEIGEAEYRRELALAQDKLAALAQPEGEEVMHLGDHIEGLVLAWQNATLVERRDMLRLVFEAVYVDITAKEIVGLKPKPAFLPLFKLDKPVKAGEVALTTKLTGDGVRPTRTRPGLRI